MDLLITEKEGGGASEISKDQGEVMKPFIKFIVKDSTPMLQNLIKDGRHRVNIF